MTAMRIAVVVAVCVVATAACANHGVVPGQLGASRAAAKQSCPTVDLVLDGAREVDRVLVPLSPEILGERQSYEFDGGGLTLISGGYFDDITEPFDDLRLSESFQIRGATAEVLRGDHVGSVVTVVLWRERGLRPPCDARAGLITEATLGTWTDSALSALRVSGVKSRDETGGDEKFG